jgi:hypothetical protein
VKKVRKDYADSELKRHAWIREDDVVSVSAEGFQTKRRYPYGVIKKIKLINLEKGIP